MADFTIAIPVYNGALFLEEALESIAAQNLEGVEVLVSDNASSDASPEILKKWSSHLPLRVIRRPQTLPMREHFNALLDEVTSDAYMLLCHDDYLADSSAIERARQALAENPSVSAVYCNLLYVNENRQVLAVRDFGREGCFDPDATGQKCLRTCRNMFGIPIAVRRSALGDLRYGDEFFYAMDIDLSWSLAKSGGAFHIAKPLIANRYSAENTTWGVLDSTLSEYQRLAAKHATPPNKFGRVRMAVTCQVVTAMKLLFRGYGKVRAW